MLLAWYAYHTLLSDIVFLAKSVGISNVVAQCLGLV